MSKAKPVLGYWDTRGLAQPIRLLLNYVGEDFDDVKYIIGLPPDYNYDAWLGDKEALGIPFANMPYYIDGDIKIAQTNAILTYLGRKYNLCGETEQERILVDILLNHAMDFRNTNTRLCYNLDFEKLLPAFLEKLPSDLKRFEDFLVDRPWLVGNKITVPDFHIYELLQHYLALVPGCLDASPNLRAYIERFEALPAIKKYMSSSDFMATPIHNRTCIPASCR